jgi:hypothetical protein
LENGMMEEDILLAVFLGLPITLGVLLQRFFRKQRQHKKPGVPRLLAGNALVLAFLCAIVVLLGEAHYRFVFDSTDSFGLTKTTKRWFTRHFESNQSGFRDTVDYLRTTADGKRRMTFLGDSFTVGHGVANVEDRFANQVRAMRPDWEVHVLASPGWDTQRELEIMKIYRDQGIQIDVVVLVYSLNDIADIVPEWQEILSRIYESPQPGFLAHHSYLFNTLYYRWKASRDSGMSNYYDFVLENYEGPVWEQQRRRLHALRDFVDSQGGRLLVVTFPFVHDLGQDYQYRSVHARLDEFWGNLNVPHLDLLSAFEANPAAKLVVNAYDAHPNERAHAIAADSIAAFIDEQLPNLPPPDER